MDAFSTARAPPPRRREAMCPASPAALLRARQAASCSVLFLNSDRARHRRAHRPVRRVVRSDRPGASDRRREAVGGAAKGGGRPVRSSWGARHGDGHGHGFQVRLERPLLLVVLMHSCSRSVAPCRCASSLRRRGEWWPARKFKAAVWPWRVAATKSVNQT